ncbi:hypothetical protein CK203_046305 [Vitis vinifera]|uniref:Uncharacterized protein n=1 Tax=Vitis vinifera TaxID=29760 RepID=A0A438FW97_VITVI|nr:hypothetical protein CK203_046305 [Vitis vinifera]
MAKRLSLVSSTDLKVMIGEADWWSPGDSSKAPSVEIETTSKQKQLKKERASTGVSFLEMATLRTLLFAHSISMLKFDIFLTAADCLISCCLFV